MALEPVEYRIGTLADFLAVPPERRAACAADLLLWAEACDSLVAVGRECEAFTIWTDDGSRHVDVINGETQSGT